MFSTVGVFSVNSTLIIPREPFIFVRHGSTDWSPETIWQGPQDLTLNNQGKNEAASIADILTSVVNDDSSYIMITSNLKRAVDTASIISDKTRIPVFLEKGLQERYYGDFSLDHKAHLNSSKTPSDAEPEDAFKNRISIIVSKIFTDAKTKNRKKILVSHGEVFKYLSKLLTKKEKTIPRGGVVVFVPSHSIDGAWIIQDLKKDSLPIKELDFEGEIDLAVNSEENED